LCSGDVEQAVAKAAPTTHVLRGDGVSVVIGAGRWPPAPILRSLVVRRLSGSHSIHRAVRFGTVPRP
jgi:hypothetical protein